MKIISVDIGYKNFCIYIEEFNLENLQQINDVEHKYNMDGSPKETMSVVLDKIYCNGKTIYHENVDISKGTENLMEIFTKMYDYLESIVSILDDCDIIIIEQQMNKNIKALKLAQCCVSFFILKYKNTKKIVEFPSYHKTCVLGAPRSLKILKNGTKKWKTLTKVQRKKWSIQKTYEILNCRNEQNIIEKMSKNKKKDDLADTITMCQAFKYIHFIKK